MIRKISRLFFFVACFFVVFSSACDSDIAGGGTALDSSAGGDADTDGDTDTDVDSDLDAGADSGYDQLPLWPSDKYISISEVYQRVQANDSDMLLLNVSDEEFYDMGHIEGSTKIPWDVLETKLDKVDSKRHIVIYCRRGVRSEFAYTTLSDNGYSLLWVMEDGLEEWIEKGYPTVS